MTDDWFDEVGVGRGLGVVFLGAVQGAERGIVQDVKAERFFRSDRFRSTVHLGADLLITVRPQFFPA